MTLDEELMLLDEERRREEEKIIAYLDKVNEENWSRHFEEQQRLLDEQSEMDFVASNDSYNYYNVEGNRRNATIAIIIGVMTCGVIILGFFALIIFLLLFFPNMLYNSFY